MPGIPNWLRFDVRLAWQPSQNLEFSVVGQNLADGQHPEFNPEIFTQRSEVRRGFYGRIRWHF